jgi:hypothetical protein
MWVGDPNSISALPFKDCYDEHDRLGVFVYRNPRMLVELVERRMVEDVSRYLLSYAGSRQEPPSFLITQEEVPYFVHLPVARTLDFLKSVRNRTLYTSEIRSGGVEGAETKEGTTVGRVLRLATVPEITEPLDEKESERLSFLPAPSVRGFEVLFQEAETQILFSARTTRDMQEYLSVMKSVYGAMDVLETTAQPAFLKQIPGKVGLGR